MDPIVSAVAAAAGRVLVQSMSTVAWQTIRDRVAELMGRQSRGGTEQVVSALEDARQVVTSGSSSGEVVALRWQGRLEALLEEDPGIAEDLRSIIDSSVDGPVYYPDVVRGSTSRAGRTQIVQRIVGGGTVVS